MVLPMEKPADAFIHLRVHSDLLEDVKRISEAEGRTVAGWVKFQIQKALKEKPKKRSR
jgi:hypothetical protein